MGLNPYVTGKNPSLRQWRVFGDRSVIREATEKGIVNAARYYYHETVSVGNQDDDVESNVRKGLDIYVKEIKGAISKTSHFVVPRIYIQRT